VHQCRFMLPEGVKQDACSRINTSTSRESLLILECSNYVTAPSYAIDFENWDIRGTPARNRKSMPSVLKWDTIKANASDDAEMRFTISISEGRLGSISTVFIVFLYKTHTVF
jgi:hypothetical protein